MKTETLPTSPVSSDVSSHSSSDSDSWDGPAEKSQSSKHQSSSRMKPNLPLHVPQLEKIKRLEYTDINTSAHMFAPLTCSSIESSYQLNLSYKSALSIQPVAAKAKITNLSQWMEVSNNFLLATLHFHPHLWPEMLVYQSKIFQYASKFPFSLVMQFDMIVRRALSLNMSKRWDERNEDAMDSFLKSDTNDTTSASTKPIPVCFSCHQPGHIAPNCPLKKTSLPKCPRSPAPDPPPPPQSNFRSQQQTSTIITPVPPEPQQPLCGEFNRSGYLFIYLISKTIFTWLHIKVDTLSA